MLYTAGICVQYSGKLAPVALLLVSFMLYFFRFVYAEVVTAMPVNGGSYNALLNTTSKRTAALASCLSMLSYVATAVVSAYSAIAYIQPLWAWAATSAGTDIGTVGLLAFFALLTLIGIGESAAVALFMFFLHVTALTVVSGFSLAYAVRDHWSIFKANCNTPFPDVLTSDGNLVAHGTAGTALFYGFAAALLGITGFETAANYVEEMSGANVYVATLRNMWLAAGMFNPIIATLAMGVLPMSEMYANSSNLLAVLAQRAGGNGLQTFLCIDGFIVLAGSVLTAYVGITGLVRRLSMDRCLPGFLGQTNSLRGTNHWIILSFFALTSSLYMLLSSISATDPSAQMDNLSGVYDMAFLSVMTAFGISAIILKWKRPDLPRLVISSWPTVFIALAFVLTGLAGTIMKDPEVLQWFFLYFGAVLLVIIIMFERTRLLKATLHVTRRLLSNSRARKMAKDRLRTLQDAHSHLEQQRRNRRASSDGGALNIGLEMKEAMEAQKQADKPGLFGKLLAAVFGSKSAPAGGESDEEGGAEDYSTLSDSLLTAGDVSSSSANGIATAPAQPLHQSESEALLEMASNNDWRASIIRSITEKIRSINAQPNVYFAKDGGDLTTLNKAVLYVRDNEQTHRLVIVHVVDDREPLAALLAGRSGGSTSGSRSNSSNTPTFSSKAGPAGGSNSSAISRQMSSPALIGHNSRPGGLSGGQVGSVVAHSAGYGAISGSGLMDAEGAAALLAQLPPPGDNVRLLLDNVALLDAMYPKLRIDCLVVRGSYFCPAVVSWLSRYLSIPANMMFMAMPDERFPHQFASLGGVRVITRSGSAAARHAQEEHLKTVLGRVAKDYTAVLSHGNGGAAVARDVHGSGFPLDSDTSTEDDLFRPVAAR